MQVFIALQSFEVDTDVVGVYATRDEAERAVSGLPGWCEVVVRTMDPPRQEIETRLERWANSIHSLRSDRLSSIGIDDFGDLRDEVPVIREWMDRFWGILSR